MVGETVPNESELSFFDVLFDRIEQLFFRDLHLGVSPSRHLDDHVQDTVVLIGKKRDVVERGENSSTLFDVNTVLESVGCAHETSSILSCHVEIANDGGRLLEALSCANAH